MNAPPEKATPGCNRANAEPQLEDAASILPADTTPGKRLATLQAKAALAGCELLAMSDGTFVLGRWSLTRALPDLDAVQAALLQMRGRP